MKPVEILISIVISAVTAGIVVYVMTTGKSHDHPDLKYDHTSIEQKIANLEQKNTNLEQKIANLGQDLPGMVQQEVAAAIANLDIAPLVKPQVDQAINDLRQKIGELVDEKVKEHDKQSQKWRQCVEKQLSEAEDFDSLKISGCPYDG